MDKSKYRDGLRAVRRYIPRLEQDLELLPAQAKAEFKPNAIDESQKTNIDSVSSDKLREIMAAGKDACTEEDEFMTDSDVASGSEALSDIFETDTDTETEEKEEQPLYLNVFEKFPVESDEKPENFERHLHQLSAAKKGESMGNDVEMPNLDEVDQMFLRAASLLKKKRR